MAENRYTKAAKAVMKKETSAREDAAATLAGKHPQIEEFEEAGGVVEDLPGEVKPRSHSAARSLIGGETPEEAIDTADRAWSESYHAPRGANLEKRVVEGWGMDEMKYRPKAVSPFLLKLVQQGVIEIKDPALTRALRRSEEVSGEEDPTLDARMEYINLGLDLEKYLDEKSADEFDKRAAKFREKNPNKPYREEGGD